MVVLNLIKAYKFCNTRTITSIILASPSTYVDETLIKLLHKVYLGNRSCGTEVNHGVLHNYSTL